MVGKEGIWKEREERKRERVSERSERRKGKGDAFGDGIKMMRRKSKSAKLSERGGFENTIQLNSPRSVCDPADGTI